MLTALLLSAALLPRVDLGPARQAMADGRYSDAESILIPLLETPEDEAARLLLAEARVATGRGLAALDVLDPLLDRDDASVQLAVGRSFLAAGDELSAGGASPDDVSYYFDMALESLGQSASLGNRDAALDAGYLALYDFADTARARSLVDEALKQHPDDGEIALLSGCVLVYEYSAAKQGDENAPGGLWKKAVAELERASKLLGDTRGEPAYQLAWLYEDKGRAEDAVDAAITHHDLTPGDDMGLLFHLALRYAGERDYGAASRAIDAMVSRDREGYLALIRAQDDPRATALTLSWAASDAAGKGRFERALELLDPLATLDPQDTDFWNNLGFFNREVGRYEESYAAYEKAVALDDGSPRLLNDTALILQYHLHRDLDHARALYEQAIAKAQAALDAGAKGDDAAELRSALTDARNNLARLDH